MNWISQAIAWLTDPVHLAGPTGLWALVGQHLAITGWATLIAVVIGVPAGLVIGHTGRGRQLVVGLSGAARALPAIGLLTMVALIAGIGLIGPLVALVVLAMPSVIAGAYSGIDSIEPVTRDAARGVGMSPMQVLWQVELPLALPQLVGGIRAAALQVIATATLAAYVGAGGLGVLLFRGLKTQDYPQMLAGSIVVVALAFLVDAAFEVITRVISRCAGVGAVAQAH
ncbi:ABC transporter permease [Propionibacterium freudenreichii]|uniref:ABC transporter permease n=1 Tax=Propionibacterium freudenreichii TaxID=1744 RepID=UPI00243446C2|nr:ABC transporter permease [Propionibacterium freudenreichii]WFF30970.1 ABC transporter permease [Propionibacterium freudenreichii]